MIYRKTDTKQPYYDELSGASAVYPVFHVVAGLTRAAGLKLVSADSSDTRPSVSRLQGQGRNPRCGSRM